MNKDELRDLLSRVQSGEISIDESLAKIKHMPYEDLGYAKLDTHRKLRRGFPEVVYCEGKTIEQSTEIISRLSKNDKLVLATRTNNELYQSVKLVCKQTLFNEIARTIIIGQIPTPKTDKYIAVVSAGTSDIPVAEEAAVTAECMGNKVERLFDVGVAGIHRLFDNKDKFINAHVIVVVAGMEGALASVVGGLVDCPVIAVPTSIGYGASFNGLAALLSMLNSCSPGVAVVNIDNGFGAGYFAAVTNLGKLT